MAPNILLTRVDNRLVHGQVGMTWVNTLGANLLIVANDSAASDPIQQNLMDMVVPETVQMRYFSIEKTIAIIGKAAPHQKILLIVKTPQDALALIEGGVPITELNIGNMHFEEGKKQISPTVSVDQNDLDTFNKLIKLNIKLDLRGIPNEMGRDLVPLLKEVKF